MRTRATCASLRDDGGPCLVDFDASSRIACCPRRSRPKARTAGRAARGPTYRPPHTASLSLDDIRSSATLVRVAALWVWIHTVKVLSIEPVVLPGMAACGRFWDTAPTARTAHGLHPRDVEGLGKRLKSCALAGAPRAERGSALKFVANSCRAPLVSAAGLQPYAATWARAQSSLPGVALVQVVGRRLGPESRLRACRPRPRTSDTNSVPVSTTRTSPTTPAQNSAKRRKEHRKTPRKHARGTDQTRYSRCRELSDSEEADLPSERWTAPGSAARLAQGSRRLRGSSSTATPLPLSSTCSTSEACAGKSSSSSSSRNKRHNNTNRHVRTAPSSLAQRRWQPSTGTREQ
eukprot:2187770-Rhodomonas_salina.1